MKGDWYNMCDYFLLEARAEIREKLEELKAKKSAFESF